MRSKKAKKDPEIELLDMFINKRTLSGHCKISKNQFFRDKSSENWHNALKFHIQTWGEMLLLPNYKYQAETDLGPYNGYKCVPPKSTLNAFP